MAMLPVRPERATPDGSHTPWTFTVACHPGTGNPGEKFPPGPRRTVRTASQPTSAGFELVGR